MKVELPEALKPVVKFIIHIAVGAVAAAAVLVIEVLLAGFIHVIGQLPFAPEWFPSATELVDQGMFVLDLSVGGLFLLAEVAKFAISLWKDVRGE